MSTPSNADLMRLAKIAGHSTREEVRMFGSDCVVVWKEGERLSEVWKPHKDLNQCREVELGMLKHRQSREGYLKLLYTAFDERKERHIKSLSEWALVISAEIRINCIIEALKLIGAESL